MAKEMRRRSGRFKPYSRSGRLKPYYSSERCSRNGRFKHYYSSHQILLVGEGDFSFALCLARAFGSASNIVATSLDSYDSVIRKYRKAKSNMESLRALGAVVLHRVDATRMEADLRMWKFDRIIFNFPHAGFHGREDDARVIEMHRNLVEQFFWNASRMLQPFGEVHVNHKTTGPFGHWNLEKLAYWHSLELIECVEFKIADYPGYNNKRGDGPRCDKAFPLGKCSTFMFILSCSKKRERLGLEGSGCYNSSGLAHYCSSWSQTYQEMAPQIPHHALQSYPAFAFSGVVFHSDPNLDYVL